MQNHSNFILFSQLILLVLILFDEPSKLSLSEQLIIAVGSSLSAICVIIGRIGVRF